MVGPTLRCRSGAFRSVPCVWVTTCSLFDLALPERWGDSQATATTRSTRDLPCAPGRRWARRWRGSLGREWSNSGPCSERRRRCRETRSASPGHASMTRHARRMFFITSNQWFGLVHSAPAFASGSCRRRRCRRRQRGRGQKSRRRREGKKRGRGKREAPRRNGEPARRVQTGQPARRRERSTPRAEARVRSRPRLAGTGAQPITE